MTGMDIELVKTFRIEAAHRTPAGRDPKGLHGHSYEIDIVADGPCGEESGWLIDYAEISAIFDPLFRALDHHTLNDVLELDEVYEADLAEWISGRIAPELAVLKEVNVRVIGACVYQEERLEASAKPDLPPRLRFGFEGAHALPNLPENHKCRRMHGHSFQVEAAASRIETLTPHLQAVYDRLDHRCLNTIDGLDNPTSEHVARWIWEILHRDVDGLRAVAVAETCTARCIYRGR